MLVLYVRSQSKLSADTFLNPAVGVAEGSLAGETALKRCHDRRGHCGQRSRRSSIAECLHLAYQDNTNRKFFSYHLPSDESIRGETDLGLVNTVLTCPLRAEVLDVLATRFHAAYLCATRECRDGSEECHTSIGPRLDRFRVPHLNDDFADLYVTAVLLDLEYKGTTGLSKASVIRWVVEEIKKGE
jgi:hypothetical protein